MAAPLGRRASNVRDTPSLMLSKKPRSQVTMEDIIEHPIAIGYLLRFCEESYCAENLHFWIAVDNFKDKCDGYDFVNNPDDIRKLGQEATLIWMKYLSQNSSTEVSLPSDDRRETINRLGKLEKLREKVFDHALRDPIKTMHNDIRSRFLQSDHFEEYCKREHQNIYDPTPVIKPPTETILDFDFPDNRSESDFTLTEIACDKYLYTAIRDFLAERRAEETILFMREIHRFEEMMDAGLPSSSVAWDIYRNFFKPIAPHEIACPKAVRKDIMMYLAKPRHDMFDDLKSKMNRELRDQYFEFKKSEEFKKTVQLLKDKKKRRRPLALRSSIISFNK